MRALLGLHRRAAPARRRGRPTARVAAARRHLRARRHVLEPRRQWPSGGPRRRGRIAGIAPGRAVAFADDPAWRELTDELGRAGRRAQRGAARRAGRRAAPVVEGVGRAAGGGRGGAEPVPAAAGARDGRAPGRGRPAPAGRRAAGRPGGRRRTTSPRRPGSGSCSRRSAATRAAAAGGAGAAGRRRARTGWTLTVAARCCGTRAPGRCSPWSPTADRDAELDPHGSSGRPPAARPPPERAAWLTRAAGPANLAIAGPVRRHAGHSWRIGSSTASSSGGGVPYAAYPAFQPADGGGQRRRARRRPDQRDPAAGTGAPRSPRGRHRRAGRRLRVGARRQPDGGAVPAQPLRRPRHLRGGVGGRHGRGRAARPRQRPLRPAGRRHARR